MSCAPTALSLHVFSGRVEHCEICNRGPRFRTYCPAGPAVNLAKPGGFSNDDRSALRGQGILSSRQMQPRSKDNPQGVLLIPGRLRRAACFRPCVPIMRLSVHNGKIAHSLSTDVWVHGCFGAEQLFYVCLQRITMLLRVLVKSPALLGWMISWRRMCDTGLGEDVPSRSAEGQVRCILPLPADPTTRVPNPGPRCMQAMCMLILHHDCVPELACFCIQCQGSRMMYMWTMCTN